MNALLSYLLTVILTAHALNAMKSETIKFSQLPGECAAEYDSFLRKERKTNSTAAIMYDLDGDGINEILIWTGNGGSGGEEWSIMRKDSRGWHRLGKVFGLLYRVDAKPYRGLLVCNAFGWDQATWSFYQLQSGKLHKTMDFEITYSRPVRERPIEIKIKYASKAHSLLKRVK